MKRPFKYLKRWFGFQLQASSSRRPNQGLSQILVVVLSILGARDLGRQIKYL